ncbi:MAG TPA: YciI family protein, partial [Solirubrobacterales bacterium]|nr:YciI family protein [Solirubrobacterales bacterium]
GYPSPPKEEAMQYLLQIYSGDAIAQFEKLSEDEQTQVLGEYYAISETPGVIGGDQLQPAETATTVRVEDGKTLTTDGPFIDTKEVLGGYYLYEADDLDAAIELASRIPAARMGGAIEVRPVVER